MQKYVIVSNPLKTVYSLDQFTIQSTTPTTTTTTTTTTPTPTTTTTITTTTTTSPPTTSNTEPPTTTKPWWFVEYSQDGKAIGKNGKTFEESVPPARFGIIGIAVGLGTFGVIMALICVLWTCCIRNKADFVDTEDDEEEKPKPIMFSPTSVKPHGIQYIA
ncbi:uncharacterized protein LOC134272384 [Saccostrea cucullata]|uniref:uncharacterized protein LOC134272384 n=1 Tax=Saccostrea cuccullata TaxID=36930 RepID=UPI002ED56C34